MLVFLNRMTDTGAKPTSECRIELARGRLFVADERHSNTSNKAVRERLQHRDGRE
jgi:hypothetical protein